MRYQGCLSGNVLTPSSLGSSPRDVDKWMDGLSWTSYLIWSITFKQVNCVSDDASG